MMMMTIALRFHPYLIGRDGSYYESTICPWGRLCDRLPIIQRAKNMAPLLVPLFISAFRRADGISYRYGGAVAIEVASIVHV